MNAPNDIWSDLFDSTEVHGNPSPVSEDSLDGFESAFEMGLPSSFRGYAEVFGPGRLSGVVSIKISVPRDGRSGSQWHFDDDLAELNRCYRGLDRLDVVEYCPDLELWDNGYFFASDSGDRYLWDTRVVSPGNEMPIYIVRRNWDVHFLAHTFESLVFDICLDRGVRGLGRMDLPTTFWAGPGNV